MQNEFVPYELAVKLKELGFDRQCFKSYFKLERHEFEDFRSASTIVFNDDEPTKLLEVYKHDEHTVFLCKAPLFQQSFDWFREKHLLHSYISYISLVINEEKWRVNFDYYKLLSYNFNWKDIRTIECDTYQEARIQCLIKLIEIVENESKIIKED